MTSYVVSLLSVAGVSRALVSSPTYVVHDVSVCRCSDVGEVPCVRSVGTVGVVSYVAPSPSVAGLTVWR